MNSGLSGFPKQYVGLGPVLGSQAPGGELHESQDYTIFSSAALELCPGPAHRRCLAHACGMNVGLSRGVQESAKLRAFRREVLPTWKKLYLDSAMQVLEGTYGMPTLCQALC